METQVIYNETLTKIFVEDNSSNSVLKTLEVGRRYAYKTKQSTRRVLGRYSVTTPYRRYRLDARYSPSVFRSDTRYIWDYVDGKWQWVAEWSTKIAYPDYWTNTSRHYLLEKDPEPSNRALKRFYSKLMDFRANMAVIFAQRQEAIDMAAQRLKQVFESLRDVKRGRFISAARRLGVRKPSSKEVSGAWLELQYGWLPLISDVFNLLNLAPVSFDKLKGRANETNSYVGWLGADVTRKRWVEYGSVVQASDDGVAFANSIGLVNPAIVAWEVLPFSFVLDWALPIGEYLDFLTAKVGISFHNAYYSVKTVSTIRYKSTNGLSIDASEMLFERRPLNTTEFPIPSLEFQNPLSPMHLANALALGRQLRN